MIKLRHDKFGNYAGTCWRLLFVYALVPWMRKYRSNEDNLGISDFKFAANRMRTGRMPTQSAFNEESDALTSLREPDVSKESDSKETDDSITVLKQQNKMLKEESEMMRSLLFQQKSGKGPMSNSCLPRMFTESSPAHHHASTCTL